eukprot:GILJ01000569.1.p1 GENE.GILJ01000569.1~~GILJ01000569.1.p1  ORF type:complete len:273 (+),score=19.96 GILJ01000569.1:37-819(+)
MAFNLDLASEQGIHTTVCYGMIVFSVACLVALLITVAPYGRYSPGKGILINSRVSWILMESPNLIVPIAFYFYPCGLKMSRNPVNFLLLSMFVLHYIHRTLIFPFKLRNPKPAPIYITLSAFLFTSVNGYMQARYLMFLADYPSSWLLQPNFWIGVITFFSGMYINIQADYILMNLRKPGEKEYKIPHGGAFEYVSGANFFGEILEWIGYAIACWNLPAFAFAFSTFSSIAPRAAAHHRWYLSKFEDYPKQRKAVIPFIW